MKQITMFFCLILFLGMTGHAQNWTVINSGITTNLTSVAYKDEMTLFATGGNGKIYTSIDGGYTWTVSYTGASSLTCIAYNYNNVLVAVGFSGTILRNDGSGWQTITSGTSYTLSSVCFPDATTGYAVGEHGTILKTTNAGLTWNPLSLRTDDWLSGVNAYDSDHAAAVSDNGGFYQTSNGGISWTSLMIPGNPFMSGVSMLGPNSGWICGTDGIMYHFNGSNLTLFPMGTWDGLMWLWIEAAFVQFFYGYSVGDYGHIFVYDNGQWVDIGSQVMEYLTYVVLYLLYFSEDQSLSDSVTVKACAVGTNGAVLLNSEVLVGIKDPDPGMTSSIIYPNPVRNGVCFTKGEIPHDGIEVIFTDLTGGTVHSEVIYYPLTPIDLRNLQDGLYIVRIRKGSRIYTQKVSVIRG